MPPIIGRGFGRDDQIIVQRVVGNEIAVQVRLTEPVHAVVEQEDEPIARVAEHIPVATTVLLEDAVVCTAALTQQIFAVVSQEGDCMSSNDNPMRMFRGDNRDADVTANWPDGTPVDFTDAKITMTVKERASDGDAAALFQRKNTAAGGSDDEVLVSSPTSGQFTVYIVPDNTSNLNPGVYVYDIQAVLSSGKVLTLVKDKFILKADVTHEAT